MRQGYSFQLRHRLWDNNKGSETLTFDQMIHKIVAGILSGILGSGVLGLIFTVQNSFAYYDDLLWGALIYYSPLICLLILFTRGWIYFVSQSKFIRNFLKTENAAILIALTGILMVNYFTDKTIMIFFLR